MEKGAGGEVKPVSSKAKIGAKELTALLTMYVVPNAFLSYPSAVSLSGMEAAWMEPLLSGLIAMALFLVVQTLIRRYFKGLDFIEIAKEAFGRGFAILVALACAAYLLASTASVMREFEENVITTVLPLTPILVVGLLFILVVWYMAYCGLEGIARTSLILLPILVLGIVAVCLMTVNWWHPYLLLPFWGAGPEAVEAGSLRYSSIFANVLLVCILYPHAKDEKSFRRVGVVSILLSAILLSGFLAVYHMVFTPQQANHMTFHLYQLARMIFLGRFFQRMEAIFIFLWVTSAVVKMAFTLWATAYLLAKAFTWPVYRPILPALALGCFSVSMLPTDVMAAVQWEQQYLLSWGWTIVFALPFGVVSLASLRKRGRRRGLRHA